mgnify:CR=1 FL=1
MNKVKILSTGEGWSVLEKMINNFLAETEFEVIAIEHNRSDDEKRAYFSALIHYDDLT